MIHYFEDNKSEVTLVLLHGTGGDEHDLVPLAKDLLPSANILSLRGRVNENGMLRFFKRLNMHTFDLASVDSESDVVLAFLREAKTKYNLKHLYVLGYSNGATMIEALLTKDASLFTKAVLLQPGLLSDDLVFPELKKLEVFTSVSNNDPYLPVEMQKKLLHKLERGYTVTVSRHNNGHGLTNDVLHDLQKWLIL